MFMTVHAYHQVKEACVPFLFSQPVESKQGYFVGKFWYLVMLASTTKSQHF